MCFYVQPDRINGLFPAGLHPAFHNYSQSFCLNQLERKVSV